jgi:HK97 family phage major capsid protein/HK97 family phage prohead protease
MKRDLQTLLGQTLRRDASVMSVDKEKRTIELSFSSEAPVERWPGEFEVLSHDAGACDLRRLNSGGPLLWNHDTDEVIGVVESAQVDADRKGRAVVRFGNSECAQSTWADVQDGILRNVSVGYRIRAIKRQEQNGAEETYLVTDWEPYEVSIVSCPADTSVGVGRSIETIHKINSMSETTITSQAASQEPKVNIDALRSEGANAERERVNTILAAGEQYGEQEFASKFLRDGGTVEAFRTALLEKINTRNKAVVEATKPIGLSERESKSFSFIKLFRALAAEAGEAKRMHEEAKFELEACSAASAKMHRSVTGTVIPTDVLLSATRANEIISVQSGTGYISTGANVIPTTLLSGSFIEVLRNKALLLGLSQELSGLVGNIDIPKQIDASTATWVGEDSAGARQAINFGLVSLRPKTVTNYAEITRRMLMQQSVGIEALVRNDLAEQLARVIDTAGFYGTGSSNQPTGIKNVSGIGSVTLSTAAKPTFAELVQMETLVALANADVASMSYVANAAFRGYAKTTRRLSTATDSNTIWEASGTVNGYSTQITNQITTGDIFFGNFKDLLVGMWGGLEVTVDPYTYSTLGRIRIVLMQDLDFAVRRAASFVFAQ